MSDSQQQTPPPPTDPDLARLDTLAHLLDNQFRIPGTNIRFGIDSLIGLIPYVGDVAGLAISGVLFNIMLRRGVGPILLLRMLGNVLLDTIVGVIPVVGDLFDFGFKANRRNVDLLKRYYADGLPKPNTKYSIGLLVLVFLALFIFVMWATVRVLGWLWGLLAAAF
jgi:hypothetical protein